MVIIDGARVLRNIMRSEIPSQGGYMVSTKHFIMAVAEANINWIQMAGLTITCHCSEESDARRVAGALADLGLQHTRAWEDSDARGERWWVAMGVI